MSMQEGAIAPPSDVSSTAQTGTSNVVDSSSTQSTTPVSSQTEQSTGTVSTGADQGKQETAPQDNVLADVPSLDELNQLPDDTKYKKALVNLRTAVETQYQPLAEKFRPFEQILEAVTAPEELQQAIDFRSKLFGWERDPDSGRLIPATQSFVEDLAQQSPDVADFLSADLLNGTTRHPETGEMVPRINLALEAMKSNPADRAVAAQILGLVEPSSIAPTWQPSQQELDAIALDPDNLSPQDKALQEVYSKLPWDERQSLKENDQAFIRKYLQREKQTQDLEAAHTQAQQREQQQQAARERYVQEQAQNAGNQYVEKGFREGFTEFANSIVAKSNFISPVDPNSEAARGMSPDQLNQVNQQIQTTNKGIATMVSTVVAALSHPDTQWVAAEFLKGIGVDEKALQGYDAARQEYANNARSYGELNFQRSLGQNGNGQPASDLGVLQSNSTRAMRNMKGQANLIAGQMMKLLSNFFEMKAGSYNSTLNGAAVARPPVQGQAFDPTTAASQKPTGWMSRQQIEQQYGS